MPRQGPGKAATDSIANGYRMALDEVQNQVGGYTVVYQDLENATAARHGPDAVQEALIATWRSTTKT